MSNENNHNPFAFIAEFEGSEESIFNISFNDVLPVLPLRNMVLFPGVILPVSVGRPSSLRVCQQAYSNDTYIVCATQRDEDIDIPKQNDLYDIGIVARVVRFFEMPDNTTSIIIQGFTPVKLLQVNWSQDSELQAHVESNGELFSEMGLNTYHLLCQTLYERLREYIDISDQFSGDTMAAINNASSMSFFVNFVCANMPFDVKAKVDLLRQPSPLARTTELLRMRYSMPAYAATSVRRRRSISTNSNATISCNASCRISRRNSDRSPPTTSRSFATRQLRSSGTTMSRIRLRMSSPSSDA